MLKIELKEHVSEEQQSNLNEHHFAGFEFLKNAGSNIKYPSDDHLSKIEKLGKAVMHLDGLRKTAKERGFSTQISFLKFTNSNNPKESWTDNEKLGLSIMLPSRCTIEENAIGDFSFIEKSSMSSKELDIISKVGFVLKESQMIESLLAVNAVNSVSESPQSKKTEEPKELATSTLKAGKPLAATIPQEQKKYWTSADQELFEAKEKMKKVRSWEMDSPTDTNKRSWE